MAETRLAFHAAPNSGRWLNDPNGLVFADGAYRLFAQHRADTPAFRETGWARFSSDDLLRWRCDGMVIAPEDDRWAYSGCLLGDGDGSLIAVHTEHAHGLEQQVTRTSPGAGLKWSEARPLGGLGPPVANRRDPFVFEDNGGWAMLLAQPCDWSDWPDQPPSQIGLFRSSDRMMWRLAGTIGPWQPSGIMWEVPILARIAKREVLIVSEIDRRSGGAPCSVRGWVGTLTDDGFVRDDPADTAGQPLDLGPDFYAMIANTSAGWPLVGPLYIGWLSNWEAARTMAWPGFFGGPISLPRTLSQAGGRISIAPAAEIMDRFSNPLRGAPDAGVARIVWIGSMLELEVRRREARLTIRVDLREGSITLSRESPPLARWSTEHRLDREPSPRAEALLFVDGPVIELFVAGLAASFFLGGASGPVAITASGESEPAGVAWYGLE